MPKTKSFKNKTNRSPLPFVLVSFLVSFPLNSPISVKKKIRNANSASKKTSTYRTTRLFFLVFNARFLTGNFIITFALVLFVLLSNSRSSRVVLVAVVVFSSSLLFSPPNPPPRRIKCAFKRLRRVERTQLSFVVQIWMSFLYLKTSLYNCNATTSTTGEEVWDEERIRILNERKMRGRF